MNRIFSGIQPTGNLHLGNYLGAIRNWVGLQDEFESIYCIVDLHAQTQFPKPAELRHNIREVTAGIIASGVDPKRCILFRQSSVPAHSELAWLLACQTPIGWLNRMTQFKEKAGKDRENAGLGLYSYPVLMAADILVYHATHVPVGEDQKQHLELCRDIAGAFNRRFDVAFFTLPEPQIFGTATRVMSLRDGSKKMSKTDASEYSRINMTDDADTIAKKIRKARTDADPLPGDPSALAERPEAANLVGIYAALEGSSVAAVCAQYEGRMFSDFKPALTELAVSTLAPIADEMRRLMDDPGHIDGILADGAARAGALARATLAETHRIMGLGGADRGAMDSGAMDSNE